MYVIEIIVDCFVILLHFTCADILNAYVVQLDFYNTVPIFSLSKL